MKRFLASRRGWTLMGALLATLLAALCLRHVFRPAETAVKTPQPEACPIQLREVSEETGITFVHTDGSSGRHYIMEAMSTGLATFDYDGDGLIDIYFPNGAPLPGTKVDKPPRHALYKNLGGFKFRDVTDEAGLHCTAYGLGVTAGDYDNDGNQDLYLNNFGPNVLFRNNGDGTFTDVTKKAGVANGDKVGAGVCFLDMDGDGNLDLYVGNYIEFRFDMHVPRMIGTVSAYPSPREYDPVPDTLYRNNGDGTFTDVSRESGIGLYAGRAMGMVCADYDNDGNTDIFVLNDVQENFFFRNDGAGRFEEAALLIGAAVNCDGDLLANMGVDCADYDNDGLLDFYSTNYQNQMPVLWHNLGHGMLADATMAANAWEGCFQYVNWGCGLVDFDNDGHHDIFVANGHTEDNVDLYDPSTSYRARNVLLRNNGAGRFVDVSNQCGLSLTAMHAARGAAFDDLDNDGDIDVVILNSRERPTILRNMLNETGSSHHWLQIRLQGAKTNRDSVGARVKVVAGNLTQIDEVHSGRGYQSHWGSRLHFGLGRRDQVDRIEVHWLGGGVDVLENVPVDRRVTITEGKTR